MLVEAEIERRGISEFCFDTLPDPDVRTHHDAWVSMKGVSHFNLGIALELLFKLIYHFNEVSLDEIPLNQRHSLATLHDNLPTSIQKQIDSDFRHSLRVANKFELISFTIIGSKDQPPLPPPERTHNVFRLKEYLEYLDEVVVIWKKRYSWEEVEAGRWRFYIGDISVFEEFINRVMQQIPRTGMST